jgi:hypothetical protein
MSVNVRHKQASPIPTMMARISSIVAGPMVTNQLDRAKVTRYRQALRRGDTFPAIWVISRRHDATVGVSQASEGR